jgi:oxygen-independent coproporphyrinogen III oxidase
MMAGIVTLLKLGNQSQPLQPLQPGDLPAAPCPGLYVHVPFCFHKCHYCDFYSITRQTPQRMTHFVDLILQEADLWHVAAESYGSSYQPTTIFFGGGTPSLLPLHEMRRLIEGLNDRFDLSGVNEWTIECNPATVSAEYCHMLRDSGVDRLSFGVQSFNSDDLKLLERHHAPDDVHRSIELAQAAGFSRLNIDLIYAIPGQTFESWSKTLEAAMRLDLSHISCYGLTYETNTPIAVRRRLGQFQPAEDDLELKMLHHARSHLSQEGLIPYEISNYARRGEECRHNLLYWTGGNYIGLGPSAASHVEGHRFKNRPHLGEWESSIERGDLPAIDYEQLTPPQRAGELVMLMLRLTQGVPFEFFRQKTGLDARVMYSDVLDRLSNQRFIEIDSGKFCLTDTGVNVADAIAALFVQ